LHPERQLIGSDPGRQFRVVGARLQVLLVKPVQRIQDCYQELIAHPVPNDLDAIKLLAASPAVLDHLCGFRTDASPRKGWSPSRYLETSG
jgi:hypothetical protein